MTYFEQHAHDHVEGMKNREARLEIRIGKMQAELELLSEERLNLECGIQNWLEEAENQ